MQRAAAARRRSRAAAARGGFPAQAVLGDRDALGAAVGTAPLSALAVTSVDFAERVRAELAVPGELSGRNDVEA